MIRVFRHYIPRWIALLAAVEVVLAALAAYVGINTQLVEFDPTLKLIVGSQLAKELSWAGFSFLALTAVGLYQPGLRDELRGLWFRIVVGYLAVGLAALVLTSLWPRWWVGWSAFLMTWLLSILAVGLFRSAVHAFADSSLFRRRLLVIGSGDLANQVAELRRSSDWRDVELVGFVAVEAEPPSVQTSKPVLAHDRSLVELCAVHDIGELVFAVNGPPGDPLIEELLECKMEGIPVNTLLAFFEQRTGRLKLDALDPDELVFAEGFVQAALKSSVHRAFDIVISLLMLVLTSWLMLLTALCIFLESGCRGPILYRQIRVGRRNVPFEILKFRSMTVDAEKHGARWATTDDPRITKVGAIIRKTRIDELPQLVNVLRGQMSFVGPRPERPQFIEELASRIDHYNLRHVVNPGITGWAQVCYPYGASIDDAKEKLQYDLYYIKNYSLFLDIMILLQTVQVILWGKGAR